MDDKLDTLIDRVERLTRLLAIGVVAGKKQAEQIALLSRAGFQPKEIAKLLETTPNTVRVALSGMRKARGKRPAKKTEKME